MKLYDNDSYRDSFTELVYALLNDDTTWDRANQIIEAFDSAPAVEVPDSIHPHGGPGDDSIEIVKPSEGDPHTYLKPCRICGNTEIVYERYRHQSGERWRCWCTKCLACIDPGWAQDRLAVRDIWNQELSNEPLTLEELLKMDGEQVWIVHTDGNEDCNGWARVELAAPWKPGGLKPHVFVVSLNGSRDYAGLLLECGVKIYRYKPKGVE